MSTQLTQNSMENHYGIPGLFLIASSWIIYYVHRIDRTDIIFALGTLLSILGIIYYIIQIRKSFKK